MISYEDTFAVSTDTLLALQLHRSTDADEGGCAGDWPGDEPCLRPVGYAALFTGCEHFGDDWAIPCCEAHAAIARRPGHPDNTCADCHAPLSLLRLTALPT